MRRWFGSRIARSVALLALVLAAASDAAAYCRTTTVEPGPGSDPDACPQRGLPLFWPARRLDYAINQRGFPGFSEDELRDVLDRSFGAWLEVECSGEPIDLTIEPAAQLTSVEPGDRVPPPAPNLIAHVATEDWQDDPRAFAITNLRYNARTGHILGADMLFNGGKDPFVVCDGDACQDGRGTDLPNVITHEAGHFLGLAHSDDPDSTMWHDAKAADTGKRSLEQDDRLGICAIYGPGVAAGPPPSSQEPVSGIICGTSGGLDRARGAGASWLWLGLVGLGLARRCR